VSEPSASSVSPAPARTAPGSPLARLWGALAVAGSLALAVALALRPLVHDDLFGHLRAGEWMVRHGAVPLADPFSFTRLGARWVSHEWGFSLLAYAVHRAAGFAGLLAGTALVTVAIFAAIALRTALEDSRPAEAPRVSRLPRLSILPALAGLGLWTVRAEIFLRAALVGELMLALVLLALTAYRRSGRRSALAAVVALFLIWANLHSGVIFGLFVLGLYALVPLVTPAFARRWPRWVSEQQRPAAPYLWTLAAALAVSFLNPNGVETLLYPFRLSRTLFASGISWDLGHFAAVPPTRNPGFLLLALLLLVGLLSRGAARPAADLLATAAFFLLTLWIPRLVFDFVVVALPVLGGLLLARGPAEGEPSGRRLREHALPAAIAAVLCLAAGRAWADRSPRLLSREVPEGGARFLAAQGVRGRMFNHQNFGGFLGWRLREPIFWDGRNDVFAGLVREVTTTPFAEVAARYGVDHLVLAEREYDDLAPELARGRWGLVYWDDDCAVYLRRGPRFAPLLARLELRYFPPFGGRPGLRELARDPRAAPVLRRELGQVLAAYPENQRALYFEGVMSLYQSDLPRARRELDAAGSLGPSEQVALALDRLAALEGAPHPSRRSAPAAWFLARRSGSLARSTLTMSGRKRRATVQSMTMRRRRLQRGIWMR